MIHYNILLKERILPAVTFYSLDEVLPVTEAILRGGLSIMEIAFRSPVAGESIALIRKRFPEMSVGAGTLLHAEQFQQAINAGALFGLAPGFNPISCKIATEKKFPFIPGVMTPSEIELACSMGFNVLKLFPAAQIGGVDFLKALNGPYEQLQLQFIPMGGVSLLNLSDYLHLNNVIAVGGSWLASRNLIESKNHAAIRRNVEEALSKIE
jgi:2-dehydro-3-deoxyphosphogluconate aldolase/(4S)-4-hydroxy-2-oxoglutarate aldolase